MSMTYDVLALLPTTALAHPATPLPAALLGLLAKVTLLLATAGLMATLLRRHAAATRHLVWLVALAGSLALVVLTPVVPRLTFALPRLAAASSTAAAVPAAAPANAATHSRDWIALGEVPMRAAAEVAGLRSLPTPPARHDAGGTPAPQRWFARALAVLWLAGCLSVLVWFALGRLALAHLSHAACSVAPERWQPLLARAGDAERVARDVRVATSERVGAPLMWGWPRPVLLLPVEALSWPELRLRDALLHELAHVARGDYLAQSLASLACAVFWFHPLAWHAAARLRSECEHACDDRVLATGAAAPEYATTLLEVARAARTLRAAGGVAVGMARRSHLEGRLLAVLDESRPRAALSAPVRALAWGVTALALVPLAGLAPRSGSASAATSAEAAPAREAAPEVKVESFGTSKKTSVTTTTHTAEATSTSTSRTAEAQPGSTFDYRAAAKPGGTLDLELKTGGTVEIRAWNEPAVSVHARLSGRDWKDTHITADPTGSGVTLRTWQEPESDHSYSTSHVFEIQVPASYDVRLKSAGGGLAIDGVAGTFRGLTGGGDIQLTHARGRAYLTTGGGTVQVTDCDMSGSVATGGGAVGVTRSRGGLVATSGSGPTVTADGSEHGDAGDADQNDNSDTVNLRVAEPDGFKYAPKTGAAGFVRVSKSGGDVDVDAAPHGAYVMTGGGNVRVGPSAGSVAVTTGGGGITLGPVAGSVWAGTGSGPVTVRLADPQGAKQTVDIASGTGKIILELPAGLDARFDLETAYTDAFGRSTAISGPWKLDVSRTQDWDGTQGTPRRFVRASGVAGNGRGLIRVRTVNGDIELRKVP
jgi:beta-lactamase regulating signal transducer with metallopeptidase domain